MRRIILLGYMGVGKTTIGRQLSKELNLPFYDLDLYIESRMHKTIKELFGTVGEEQFRRIEHNMLREVGEFEDIILSLGGGTPCFFDNMEYANRQGETIYLKANVDTICQHLRMSGNTRPLLQGKNDEELRSFIQSQLQEREPFYAQAKHIFEVPILNNTKLIKQSAQQIAITFKSPNQS